MSQPTIVNLQVTRGDDFGAEVTFDQAVAGFSEIRFTVRETWAASETDNAEAVYTATLTPSGTYTASFEIPNATTVTWLLDEYVYDVAVLTTGSKKYTTQRGTLRMTPDVSR